MKLWRLAVICALLALPARGEEARSFRLEVAADLAASGLMHYMLPRFSLKTGRRAEVVADGGDAVIGADAANATPVMARGGVIYALRLRGENDAARRFAAWLSSDIGQETLAAFRPETGPSFTPVPKAKTKREIVLEGDPAVGRRVADIHCARCHRVHPEGTGIGIGSTPSFAALRALPDWDERFATFFVRNPHPAFLRIKDVSPEFDISRPPPIVPVQITYDEVLAVQAYVAGLTPADLGAPVASN